MPHLNIFVNTAITAISRICRKCATYEVIYAIGKTGHPPLESSQPLSREFREMVNKRISLGRRRQDYCRIATKTSAPT
jgi:hypothetical protein